ncbi:collagen-binding domain-containing protein [Paracoccus angustae]|uniref:Collagen-binding domain-containing protein n=1 Tax=Paracoccus angustae TaxID=1671480 RepID=A0ABV7U9T7_9RHOB
MLESLSKSSGSLKTIGDLTDKSGQLVIGASRMRFGFCTLAVVGCLVSQVSVGEAATLGATDLLKQFNLITKGDVTGSAGFHADGRVLAGGDYKVQAGSVVYMNAKGDVSDFDELIVRGNVEALIHVNQGGNAVAGWRAG